MQKHSHEFNNGSDYYYFQMRTYQLFSVSSSQAGSSPSSNPQIREATVYFIEGCWEWRFVKEIWIKGIRFIAYVQIDNNQLLIAMHTTTVSKGKGKLVKMDQEMLKRFQIQFEGAYSLGHFYEAFMDSVSKWYKARILSCRLARAMLSFLTTSFHQDYDARFEKDENSYEYYVHFEPLNRRNDQWLPAAYLRPTGEEIPEEGGSKKRGTKEKVHQKYSEHEGMDQQSLQVHLQLTKFKTVHRVRIGQHQCDAWYYSSYPPMYHNIDTLYLCQFCLSFYAVKTELLRHSLRCPLWHPPGDEIYRDQESQISVFEVDGLKNPVYCENLSFLSKLFLDHKNIEYDTTVFLYYILTEIRGSEYHLAGYFSKPKDSPLNLSCILVLPYHQRKGYGKFLISLSYEFSLIQGKTGTPQKPLSDLGKETYLAWWSQRLIDYLRLHRGQSFTLEDIIRETAMSEEDILWTLETTGLLKIVDSVATICSQQSLLSEVYSLGGRAGKRVERQLIHWVPFRIKWEGCPLNY